VGAGVASGLPACGLSGLRRGLRRRVRAYTLPVWPLAKR